MTLNKKRKYSHIKLAGDSGVLFTALHTATDRWNEAMGCVLRTGGETDFVVANYDQKIAKNQRRLERKASSILESSNVERPTGTSSSE